ncbi:cytochrome d ubiquinol oxidase subunit II [Enterobacteriaceae bacterium H20N1]|uniref:Cytochrome d ubiquinol oxidase subunit II n=1 Tax=Dryocola boscaweniae TaxID=2925397 RepID=A0A9X2WAP1_9ENTR|nr:cytochrome d ubiquinol oxidase subunit II [Dryocola boscaweniae]MCT4703870.1 cytochrome d ubiquinol oxidase subunit II [Dryocola boscaweniae]MCT4717050.1 cytochrome d ubiquinol oxidase subunit II [Dryocola boscaweniae]MCT4721038.1 cytochrome d ubiquinol oxidase subunit II [Dryocola boscaweniae]
MGIDLSIIWFVIIVFSTLMYIVMDGFDLGIGILFPFIRDNADRDVMVNSVAPVWDGNETWLVLGGAGLFGAFPLAYAVIVDALTIPLTLMLIGLIFRGVAFEFRFKATPAHRPFWDKAFLVGSILATFCQGIVVGAVISGFPVAGRAFAGTQLDWLTAFNLFCGVGLVVAYALLGASWLVMKSEDPLQQKMRELVKPLLLALLIIMAIISIWTPLTHSQIATRWFSLPNLFWLLPVPVLVVLFSFWLWKSSYSKTSLHSTPFVLTLALIFLGFSGLGISIWPYIIPPSVTLWQAAAPPQSQGFMLVGALFIIPIILVYTFWSYYVFRGKVQHGEGYH